MITDKNKQENPTPWYWSQPEQGISLEDCETLFYELINQYRSTERSQKRYTSGDTALAL
ncbi:MAG: hypothetical protein LUG51_14905 [Tannerellaceae bacterium]|nr:hypothetical protein [Tannerellaceae bacterium]